MALWAQFQIVAVCPLSQSSVVGSHPAFLYLYQLDFFPLIVGSFLLHGRRFNVYKTKHNFLFHFYDNGWMDVYLSLITSWFYELLLPETERVGVSSSYSEKERQMTRILSFLYFWALLAFVSPPFLMTGRHVFLSQISSNGYIYRHHHYLSSYFLSLFSPTTQKHFALGGNIIVNFWVGGGVCVRVIAKWTLPTSPSVGRRFQRTKKKIKTWFTRRFLVRLTDWTRPISTCYQQFHRVVRKKHRRERDELSGKKNF